MPDWMEFDRDIAVLTEDERRDFCVVSPEISLRGVYGKLDDLIRRRRALHNTLTAQIDEIDDDAYFAITRKILPEIQKKEAVLGAVMGEILAKEAALFLESPDEALTILVPAPIVRTLDQ